MSEIQCNINMSEVQCNILMSEKKSLEFYMVHGYWVLGFQKTKLVLQYIKHLVQN